MLNNESRKKIQRRKKIKFKKSFCSNNYNNSNYKNCKEYYQVFNKQFSILVRKGVVEKDYKKNLFWVLCTGYMLLIESSEISNNVLKRAEAHRDFLLENYPYHYTDFCMQFAKTLYKIPVVDRLNFLDDKIQNNLVGKSISEAIELNNLLGELYV